MALDGIIVKGLSEGAYFMSLEHYKKEIKKKLGFDAFPGTLNVKVSGDKINILKNFKAIKINGFKKNNKEFYGIKCYRAKVENIDGAILIPRLDKHGKNIIEFIAPVNVKSELKIKDGDKVTINII